MKVKIITAEVLHTKKLELPINSATAKYVTQSTVGLEEKINDFIDGKTVHNVSIATSGAQYIATITYE